MNWRALILLVAVAIGGLLVGRWTASWWSPTRSADTPAASADAVPKLWTCPMHPEVKLPEFGTCPKCGMDLVPLTKDDDGAGPRQLAMSEAAVALAEIETAPVTRRFVTKAVRMVGKVDYDETRVRSISARVAGRLDRLYVDYAGIPVQQNDHLVSLYSPALLIAQQELIEAKARLAETGAETSAFLRDSNRRGYQAARDKLLLWGLTADQVDAIETRGTAEDHMLIRSPAAGVVITKHKNEGDYVQEGTPIYTIADLSHLWIQLAAYEQDLPWLRYGQGVSVYAEAFPGEPFEGRISFVDPVVDQRTRTVRVRVNVDNEGGRLKPGMFVRGVVRARIGGGGQVLEPSLAGKWISPMHPEIVKDGPGTCDVCGMDLVPAESLGYTRDRDAEKPLVVPASAVLVTGTRAVVYVAVDGREKPTFEGREVVLGPRAGDAWIVRQGLAENERVVVAGAFRIDSAMQIQARPSMMSMPGQDALFTGPETALFRRSLRPVYDAYLATWRALAGDDFAAARAAAQRLVAALDDVDATALPLVAREQWDDERLALSDAGRAAVASDDIDELRRHFEPLANAALALERTFRHAGDQLHAEAYCPMAFDDRGASWLQVGTEILNPYFGAAMLACGEVRAEFAGIDGQPAPAGPSRPEEPPRDVEPPPPARTGAPDEPARAPRTPADPGGRTADLGEVYDRYLDLQRALFDDDADAAHTAFVALGEAARRAAAPGDVPACRTLVTALEAPAPSGLAALRQRFGAVSDALLAVHDLVGHPGAAPLYRVHCPMARDGAGGDWLSRERRVDNPYFGASMPHCGSVTATLEGRGDGR